MSLPGSGGPVGRLSASPPTVPGAQGRRNTNASGLTRAMDQPSGLVARETVVATWNLRRGRDWAQIKQVIRNSDRVVDMGNERLDKTAYVPP